MKPKADDWTYINPFRRYRENQYQLYFEGRWIPINLEPK